MMKPEKPTYEELEKRVEELEKAATERIESEATLRSTRKRFMALFEQAPVGIAVIDSRTGQFLDINDAYCRIVGYPKPDMLVMDFMRITHPDDLQEDLDKMARLRAGEISRFQMEKRYFRKDGSIVWVSLTVVPLWEERADPLHHIAMVEDITQRKQAEEALKASELKFRNIAENMPGMVLKYKLNPDGSDRLLYISRGVEDLFEVSREDAVNNNKLLWDRIHQDDLKEYVASIKISAENLSPWEQEHRLQLPGGRVKWVHARGVPVKLADGSIVWDTLAVDITDRKTAEEALREAHTFLQQIIDNSQALIVAKNRSGEYILANDISARLLGLRKDEMIGRTDYDLFPKETADRLTEDDKRVFETGDPLQIEEKIRIADGDHTFMTTKFPLFDANGKLYAICAMATDITERREMESALKESEERFRAIFEQAAAGIAAATAEGRFLETNQALCDMLGYSAEELSEMTVYDITFPEDREQQIEKDKPVLEGKQDTLCFEKRFIHKDGHPVWVQLSSHAIRDEEGEIQYVIGVVVDTNKQKRAEAALRKAHEDLTATLDAVPDFLFEVDPDGRILGYHTWKEDLLYVQPVLFLNKSFREILPADAADVIQRAISDALTNGKHVGATYMLDMPSGQSWYELSIAVKTVRNDRPNRLIMLARDITARKVAEAALQHALAEKETLLREIHHRVKNNMQTIISMLRMHSRKTVDPDLANVFSDCRVRIEAMSLIHEALYQSDNLSRIDFGAYIKKLCRNIGQAHDAGGKGISLTANAGNVSLNMDQGIAVGMIITELISNAFKHAFPGEAHGRVGINVESIDTDEIELTVADDGAGLPADFDIRKPSSLGLRLVEATVTRELGGTIDVARDNGARFVIRFKCESE